MDRTFLCTIVDREINHSSIGKYDTIRNKIVSHTVTDFPKFSTHIFRIDNKINKFQFFPQDKSDISIICSNSLKNGSNRRTTS